MRLLKKMIHKDIKEIKGNIFERKAARAIILNENKILLMYTKRYDDYSFPGGGVESNEDLTEGLKRELTEETGAKNIEIIKEFGIFDEYRPTHYEGYDLMHMTSYFYVCKIAKELGEPNLEDYEISNGMTTIWIDIEEAINHNTKLIQTKDSKMGLSVERETFMLNLIKNELIDK
ncbi:NUDIX domain-containing protein [Tepidibacter mesophilus]|uniref:NUDIX domain-containing protein n=1 Tax=Tepidibacter mesophilus TaxID=655607 RepID=UPI000C081517|nr:NUDIX domain-containing protein [Tepidibacter mesophilus]